MASASNLLDNITDKVYECSMCLEELKEPTTLPCRHKYCTECLEPFMDQSSVKCPLCGQTFAIPVEKDEYTIEDEDDTENDESIDAETKPKETPKVAEQLETCFGCYKRVKPEAYCFRCDDNLCKDCYNFHMTNNMMMDHRVHVLTMADMEAKMINIQKQPTPTTQPMCEKHPKSICNLSCETCMKRLICVDCTYNDHKNHDYKNIIWDEQTDEEKFRFKLAPVLDDHMKKAKRYDEMMDNRRTGRTKIIMQLDEADLEYPERRSKKGKNKLHDIEVKLDKLTTECLSEAVGNPKSKTKRKKKTSKKPAIVGDEGTVDREGTAVGTIGDSGASPQNQTFKGYRLTYERRVRIDGFKTWRILSITCTNNGTIVVSKGRQYSKISMINVISLEGKIRKYKKLEGRTRHSSFRICEAYDEFKVATICEPDEVGMYDTRDGTYIKTSLIDDVSCWPKDQRISGIATDSYNNLVLAGCQKMIFIFNDELKFIRVLPLPGRITLPEALTVSPKGHLVVCDYEHKKASAVSMVDGKYMYEYIKPECRGRPMPFRACSDREGYIYVLWGGAEVPDEISKFANAESKRCILAQYENDSGEITTTKWIDGDTIGLALFERGRERKAYMPTLKSGSMYIYNLVE